MESRPKSLHRRFRCAISSRVPIPRLEPSNPIVSYCSVATTGFPFSFTNTLQQAMTQPVMQVVPTLPPRSSVISRSRWPYRFSAASKLPSLKLRVGNAPISLTAATMAEVPYMCIAPLRPVLGLSISSLANRRADARNSSGSASGGASVPEASRTTALSPLLPMTAPSPPRAATRVFCSPCPVQTTPAAPMRNSPACPMEMTVQSAPHRSRAFAAVAYVPSPRHSSAGSNSTPVLDMYSWYSFPSAGWPSTTSALTPRRARSEPPFPPQLASLTPPVRGLLPPMESLPELDRLVPPKSPGAKMSLLFGPRGSHWGGTSVSSIFAMSARPPRRSYSGRTDSHFASKRSIFTLRVFTPTLPY